MNERPKQKKLDEEFYNDETSHFFTPKDHQDDEVTVSLCYSVPEAVLFKKQNKNNNKKKHEWKTVIEMITKIFGEMVARIGPMKNLKNV